MSLPPRAPPPPLLDVLGAQWALDVPVVGVEWDGDCAGFALGDGSVAIGRSDWDGAARLERVDGGTHLTPATAGPPPLIRQRVHDGACLSIAAQPGHGFMTGGDDGAVVQIGCNGTAEAMAQHPGDWVTHVAAGAGCYAAAAGRRVHIASRGGTHVLDLPASATALAFDRSGTQLAAAYYRGATLWTPDRARRLVTPGCPLSLAWSPDGRYVVCGLQENALHGWRVADGGDIEMGGYPGQPRSLSFAGNGALLASSGAPQVVCWRFDPPAGGQPIECGLPNSRLPVCAVAFHPRYPMVAAGYHNGAVLLCQPGTDDVLFVKGSSGGSVNALAWSGDGLRLAVGTQGGELGLVNLPGLLFRFDRVSTAVGQAGLTPPQRAAVA